MTGDATANLLRGGVGADTLDGGAGSDWADYLGATAGITVNLLTPSGNTGEAAGDTFTSIENIRGSSFADRITGDGANNILRGGLGGDTLDGGTGSDWADYAGEATAVGVNLTTGGTVGAAAGDTYVSIENVRGGGFNDILVGTASANSIQGGLGNDTLTGGGGADQFQFNSALNATTNVDIISDFVVVDDTIQLENGIFTALTVTGTLAVDQFVSGAGTTAIDANDYIVYDTASGDLFYDADGSGAGAQTKFAHLTPGFALTNNDFLVI
jgi:serralysin